MGFAALTVSAEIEEPLKLGNGLTVFLRPIPTANNVAIVVLYNIGEDHDPVGKSGMAHLLEHLYVTAAAGNTPMRDVSEFVKRYPLGWNAQTGKDYTVIAGVVNPNQFSDELMDVATRMHDLRITEEDVEREIPRVIQELKNMYGGIPMLAAINHIRTKLHPIPQDGQRGGSIAHIQTITVEELQKFWNDYYKPNNAILIITGKFDKDNTLKSIRDNFNPIPAGIKPPDSHPKSKPDISKVHRIKVKPVIPNATGLAAIGYAVPSLGSKEFAPLLIVYSRLVTKLHSKVQRGKIQPLFFPLFDDHTTIVLQRELLSNDDVETVLQGLNQTLQDVLTSKVTMHDKRQTFNVVGTFLNTVEIPDALWVQNLYGLAFSIGRRHQLKINTKEISEAIESLTDADMQHLARSIFDAEKRATVVIELNE